MNDYSFVQKEKQKIVSKFYPARHILTAEDRARGRKSICEGPRKNYQILISEKTQLQLMRIGTDRVRRLLIDFAEGINSAPPKNIQSPGEICSWCLDTADVEIQIEKGANYCARCGQTLRSCY
jgi:hypothetical protein